MTPAFPAAVSVAEDFLRRVMIGSDRARGLRGSTREPALPDRSDAFFAQCAAFVRDGSGFIHLQN